MRVALLQMTSGIDPAANAAVIEAGATEARAGGAAMLFIPEMSGLLDRDRSRASSHIYAEGDDPVLQRVCAAAAKYKIWIGLGSLALKSEREEGRFVNRSFMIDDRGQVRARYDKMHLFDATLADGEQYRESSAYTPGDDPVMCETPVGKLGLSICYDFRFPALYQAYSHAGATLLSIPAAFTVPTGKAHWHSLMRARAIENGAFVIAAAQSGHHEDGRSTYGHSLVVGPWGDVILDMEEGAGLGFAEIEHAKVTEARTRIPVLDHRRSIPQMAQS